MWATDPGKTPGFLQYWMGYRPRERPWVPTIWAIDPEKNPGSIQHGLEARDKPWVRTI